MPTLTIQLPNMPPVEHILREEVVTLGRMKGNTIALDDSSVSISHAKITRIGQDYFLKDLNSTNGTMLNGQSINEARLRDGDRLKFGEVLARFFAEPVFSPELPKSGASAPASPEPATKDVSEKPAPVPPERRPAPESRPVAPKRSAPRKQLSPLGRVLVGIVLLAMAAAAVWLFVPLEFLTRQPAAESTATEPANAEPAAPATVNPPALEDSVDPRLLPPELALELADSPPPADGGSPTPVPPMRSLSELRKALRSADVAVRRRAAEDLSALEPGDKELVPALRDTLKDSDPEVRMWGAVGLINNQTYDREVVPVLVRILRHENPTLRQVACISLALFPYEPVERDAVISALNGVAVQDGDEEVRRDAQLAIRVLTPDPDAP